MQLLQNPESMPDCGMQRRQQRVDRRISSVLGIVVGFVVWFYVFEAVFIPSPNVFFSLALFASSYMSLAGLLVFLVNTFLPTPKAFDHLEYFVYGFLFTFQVIVVLQQALQGLLQLP